MKKIIITLSIFTALIGENFVYAQEITYPSGGTDNSLQLDSTLNPPPTYTAPDNVYDNLIPYTPPTNSPGPTIQNAEGLPPATTIGNDVPVSDTNSGTVNNDKNVSSGKSVTLQNPLKVKSIQEVIYLAVDLAIYVGVSFAILALIFVGFQFVAAQGNEEKLKKAKEWFFYIIIGLAILISAKVIVLIVKNTLINAGVVDSKVFTP